MKIQQRSCNTSEAFISTSPLINNTPYHESSFGVVPGASLFVPSLSLDSRSFADQECAETLKRFLL